MGAISQNMGFILSNKGVVKIHNIPTVHDRRESPGTVTRTFGYDPTIATTRKSFCQLEPDVTHI
jgi:hypothetical protein